MYQGECHILCSSCHGPNYDDCTALVRNAVWDEDADGATIYCDDQDNDAWVLPIDLDHGYCTYSGTCHAMCATCFGDTWDDCLTCSTNAYFNHAGRCQCLPDYGGHSDWVNGSTCDYYTGI